MKVIDLFCGCGGLSLGFEQAGHEIVGAFDAWKAALETYDANMTHKAGFFDLSDAQAFLETLRKKSFEIIIGGPPCQDFSSAGHRREREKADLTRSYARIVADSQPRFFLMENVARLRTSQAYKDAREIFMRAGYGLTETVLDASYCGVPQIRKRFFCIGSLGEKNGFMSEVIQAFLSHKRMTVREYLGKEIEAEHYYRHPRNYSRRAVFSINEPSATVRGVSRPVPEGYKGHPRDSAPINETLRSLTTLERSRLQTFPRNFKWVGSKTEVEQMIGNAVPVAMAKFMADCLNAYVKRLSQETKKAA